MDSRLIFLHYSGDAISLGGRRKVGLRAIGNARPRFKGDSAGKSAGSLTLRKAGKRVFGRANWLILRCQEKPR